MFELSLINWKIMIVVLENQRYLVLHIRVAILARSVNPLRCGIVYLVLFLLRFTHVHYAYQIGSLADHVKCKAWIGANLRTMSTTQLEDG